MKILYLAHRIPYPPNKGDKIRSFNEIKHLSQEHEIHLACLADDSKDLKYEEELKKYCKAVRIVLINPKMAKLKSIFYLLTKQPLTVPYFYSLKLQRAVDRLLSTIRFDAIFCFSSPMAEYVFKSKLLVSSRLKLEKSLVKGASVTNGQKRATGNQQPKLIMDFVDVDSDKWAQYAKYASFPKSWIYRLESKRLAAYETRVAELFDHSIFVTRAEVEVFKKLNPHIEDLIVISNGVNAEYFSPTFSQQRATSNQHPIIVFTGAMDYFANVDGVVWFTKEILPLIKKKVPEVRFYIVGSKPTKEVVSLASNSGVTVTGYVPDTREYLNKATVVVVPLRIARGIQNKILEAMAMAIPVIATPQAFEGINATSHEDLLVKESPGDFAQAVVELLCDPTLRNKLGNNARCKIGLNYSWAKDLGKLSSLLTIGQSPKSEGADSL